MRRLDGGSAVSDVCIAASPLHKVLHISTDASCVRTDVSVDGVGITTGGKAAVAPWVLVVSKPGFFNWSRIHANGVDTCVRLTDHCYRVVSAGFLNQA